MNTHDFKIFLINPPHTAIGSRVPKEHLPPLCLLSIGGPLLDQGFHVELLDAEFGPMAIEQIVEAVVRAWPHVVMVGHSGSTSAHATIDALTRLIRKKSPGTWIVYGGVFPTYHWEDILNQCPQIDFIVRGQGELTATLLATALYAGSGIANITGIAYRKQAHPITTRKAELIDHLDDFRIGWELIDHAKYSYWGNQRAVVVQFSRGCPHACNYCGQRGFWTQWRHRDPVKFARELAWLHREHGVEVINFADELPTGSRKAWQTFLEALIAEKVNLTLVGSTRASDIVRDADILHLYREAGVIRFLLGIETYSESTLKKIGKGTSCNSDKEAIRLLRRHGIISMATYVVGFEEESDRDYWHSLKHLLEYDPDQIQILYVTPHRWTPFYSTVEERKVIQIDTRKWDYKHQVLATNKVPPWRVLLWVKTIEVILQLRPKALLRTFFSKGDDFAHGMRWYAKMGRRVWFREIAEFVFGGGPSASGPTLRAFWGESLAASEEALSKTRTTSRASSVASGERR